jgi:hypothetical protein
VAYVVSAFSSPKIRDAVSGTGAADVEQQSRVERLRCLLLVGMHLVAQPPRDQRTVQAVLERHADAEIRRQ